ncbi:hypothetical protein Bca4012_080497 [Brassica carinata]
MLRREKEEVEEGGGCRWSLLIASSSSRMEAAEGAELLSLRLRVGTGGAVTFPALKQHPISVSTLARAYSGLPIFLLTPTNPIHVSLILSRQKETVLFFVVVKEKSKFHAGGQYLA